MRHVFVYADSLSWGIVPGTRRRLPFDARWPGVLEGALDAAAGGDPARRVRVVEDCLNGRRTVWDDPFKAGRNGRVGLAERIEAQSPLALVVLMLGTNDFQSMHPHVAWHAAQGVAALVREVRAAPIEPGMPQPPVLVVAPPPPGVATGPIAPKFAGAEARAAGFAAELRAVCAELGCAFFDAGAVVAASRVDGVHLDAPEHATLGRALAAVVAALIDAPAAPALSPA